MPAAATTDVLVLVSEAHEAGSILATARRRGWPVLHDATLGQVFGEVRMGQVRVVIMQIRPPLNGALDVIQALRSYWRPVYVLTVGPVTDPRLEQALRCAGAHCVLGSQAGAQELEEAVDTLLCVRDAAKTSWPARPLRPAAHTGAAPNATSSDEPDQTPGLIVR